MSDGELIFIFPTPVVRTNIGRSFTKDEMRCILNIPMGNQNPRLKKGVQSECFEIFDIFAEDIRLAMREISKISGNVDIEDILEVIFNDFCIGK